MSKKLLLHKYIIGTEAEGPGKRMALWVQGCTLHCPGCFERDTWDANKGFETDILELKKILHSHSDIEGVTVLGGEPMEQAEALFAFLKIVKEMGLNTIVFSGYTYEKLKGKSDFWIERALSFTDLLIDGRFDSTQLERNRSMVGSQNQRFIYLSDAFEEYGKVEFRYKNCTEIRISKEGSVSVNGMWK